MPACILPFRDMDVWADGKAVLCCEDWNEEYVVGDLTDESLAEVWRGRVLSEARALHASGRGSDVFICAKCDHWQRPPPMVRLWV